jgi:hypothetical protein
MKTKLFAVSVLVVVLVSLVSCQFVAQVVGIPDPEVKEHVWRVVDSLQVIYENSEDAVVLEIYAQAVIRDLRKIEDTGNLSQLDRDKMKVIWEGVLDLSLNLHNPPYVRQMARALQSSVGSLSEYDDTFEEDVEKVRGYINGPGESDEGDGRSEGDGTTGGEDPRAGSEAE